MALLNVIAYFERGKKRLFSHDENSLFDHTGFKIRFKNCFVRSSFGRLKISSGGPCSTMTPPSIKITSSATSWANLISCVTTAIVQPSFAKSFMTFKTSPTSSGSSAEVGSSKSISSG
ncbi:glutamate binding periplasmic protein [Bacillus stratosphericus LAMA 585]|nr:glutamate binding periplasmic protein [Bacillus stratosphericus LAMA 585]